MNKIISLEEIPSLIKDGMTIMIGGFMGVGTPQEIVSALLEVEIKDLTVIVNDTAFPETGVGPLIKNKIEVF